MREMIFLGLAVMLIGLGIFIRYRLRRPSRQYEGPASVSDVYDHWTQERILEYYWGDHLHAGYYGDPPIKKNFIAAKVDMIDEMVKWGIAEAAPALMQRLEQTAESTLAEKIKILDVGCGIGGSTRHLAKRWNKTAHVTGITISKAQVER
ncbi:MAG TPA: methyltransferase domain-containing protein, partial [Anaerolineales bacterium]|nr:methyltransferase domain-containing protein [Anaerolineales bacterium]